MIKALKNAIFFLNLAFLSSYLALNVELIVGMSLVLVFGIMHQGLKKMSLNGIFLAIDNTHYYYYYLLSLNGLASSSISALLKKMKVLVKNLYSVSFLVVASLIAARNELGGFKKLMNSNANKFKILIPRVVYELNAYKAAIKISLKGRRIELVEMINANLGTVQEINKNQRVKKSVSYVS